MGLLIDTSVFISIERSDEPLEGLFGRLADPQIYLSAISASELLHGVHRANDEQRRRKRELFVEAILGFVPILPVDLHVARAHSRVWADLSRRGEQIGGNDLWIAATALAHGHSVLTANVKEFQRVDNLLVVAWLPIGTPRPSR